MLKCRDVAHRASEYLDGETNRRFKWQMRLHLAMCRHCRRFMRHLRTTRTLVGKVGQIEPCPAPSSRKIVQIIRQRS